MLSTKYLIAFGILIAGIVLIPFVGYGLGIILVLVLIAAAGYLLWTLIKQILNK